MSFRPRVALLSIAVALGACDKTVPTPAGTKVLDQPAFTKMSMNEWTVGPATAPATAVTKTYRYEMPASLGPEVRFKVSFEHGPSELIVAKPKVDKPPPVETPRNVKIEVVENPRWAITAKCDPDLKVPLEVNANGSAAYPKVVWAHCDLVMKRKNGDITVAPWIDLFGDGKLEVRAVGSADERVIEE